jgi:hypothetical protein
MAEARVVLTAVDKTSAAFASAQKGLSGIGAAAMSAKGALATLGLGAVGAALISQVKTAANYADEMGKLAQRAGVTSEAISGLAYAARLSDVDNNTLARGLRALGSDAADGGKKLGEFGISITDAAGKAKTSEALFLEVSDRLAGIESPAKRAAVAAKLFGDRVGPELMPLLSGGSAAIKGMTDEAARFGKVVSDEAAAKAAEFNDNLTRLQATSEGIAQQLAGPMITTLANTSSYFIKVANDVGLARAALITFGAAVSRTLGVDDVGQLQSRARANQSAIALTVKQIENFQRLADRGVDGAADRVKALREQYTLLQRDGQKVSESLKSTAKSIEDEFTPVVGSKLPTPDLLMGGKPPKPPGSPRVGGAKGGAFNAPTYDEQITQRVGKLFEDSDLTKAKEYTDTLAKLDDLYYAGAISGELYDSALKKLTGSTAQTGEASTELADQQARLAQLLSGTASAALEGQRKDMDLLTAALEKGIITEGLYLEAVTERLKLGAGASPVPPNASADFAGELRDDVKSALSNAFRDTKNPVKAFAEGLGNIVFTRLSTSVAEALATAAFGNGTAGSSGFLSTALNSLFSFDGGGYTGSGSRSGGMDGKGGFVAMLHPNETVVDHTKGQSTSSQSVVVNINNVVGDVASQSVVIDGMRTVRAQIMGELNRSMRYGGAAA